MVLLLFGFEAQPCQLIHIPECSKKGVAWSIGMTADREARQTRERPPVTLFCQPLTLTLMAMNQFEHLQCLGILQHRLEKQKYLDTRCVVEICLPAG